MHIDLEDTGKELDLDVEPLHLILKEETLNFCIDCHTLKSRTKDNVSALLYKYVTDVEAKISI